MPVSASWPPTLNDNSCSDNNKCRNSRSKVLNKVKTKSSHVTVMSSQSALGTRLSYVTTQIPCQATKVCGAAQLFARDASAVSCVVSSLSKYFPCFQDLPRSMWITVDSGKSVNQNPGIVWLIRVNVINDQHGIYDGWLTAEPLLGLPEAGSELSYGDPALGNIRILIF